MDKSKLAGFLATRFLATRILIFFAIVAFGVAATIAYVLLSDGNLTGFVYLYLAHLLHEYTLLIF